MDIITLGTKVVASKSTTLEQARFSSDGSWTAQTISGVSYLVANMQTMTDQIHKFIYEDIKPAAKTN